MVNVVLRLRSERSGFSRGKKLHATLFIYYRSWNGLNVRPESSFESSARLFLLDTNVFGIPIPPGPKERCENPIP